MKESTKQRLFDVVTLACLLLIVILASGAIYCVIRDAAAFKDRLREEGRVAALNGVSDAGNPYQGRYSDAAKLWLEGWIEGKKPAPAKGGVR